MADRYAPEQVVHVNVAICKTSDVRIAVGAELYHRKRLDDGRVYYDPFAVCSLIYGPDDVKTVSLRQVIPVACAEILRYTPQDTKLVVFRSFSPSFHEYRRYEAEVGVIAQPRGIEVKFNHSPQLRAIASNHAMLLANDAIRRGESLSCVL